MLCCTIRLHISDALESHVSSEEMLPIDIRLKSSLVIVLSGRDFRPCAFILLGADVDRLRHLTTTIRRLQLSIRLFTGTIEVMM